MYDAIVVGGRCAGSPVSMLLAKLGYWVLNVDKDAFPKDTISTHYLHPAAIARLRRWGLLDRLLVTGCSPITRMTLALQDRAVSGFPPATDGVTATYAPRRTVLDHLLRQAASEAGAELRENFSVQGLLVEDGTVVGIRGREHGGKEVEERSRIVIGADGRHSKVANWVEADSYHVVPASGFIYYSYWSGLDRQFESRIQDLRQVGVWPTNDDLTLVTVMRRQDAFDEFRANVPASFDSVVRHVHPELAEEIDDRGNRIERFVGTVNVDNRYRRASGAGWALVGDAGFHQDPLTGHGINDAFRDAELLSNAVHSGLYGTRPMADALADYECERNERTKSTYDLTCAIATLDPPADLTAVFGALAHHPEQRDLFFGLLSGVLTAEEFFTPENISVLMSSASDSSPWR